MKNKLSLCEPITYATVSDLMLAPQKAVGQEDQLQPIKTGYLGYLASRSRHGTMSSFTEVRKSIMPLGKVGAVEPSEWTLFPPRTQLQGKKCSRGLKREDVVNFHMPSSGLGNSLPW